VHSLLHAILPGKKLYYTQQTDTVSGGFTMRVIKPGPAILGDGVLRDFAGSLRAADLAEATRRGYASDLARFRAWIEEQRGAAVPLRRISAVDLASYRQHLMRGEKLRAASVNRRVQALKKFFAWAEQKKLVSASPASALRFLRRAKRSQPVDLRAAETQALLRAAGQTGHGLARRNYALLQLLLQTGLRVGEVSRLAIADCEMSDRSGVVHVRGKGGKERDVPLNASARRAVTLYLNTREEHDAQEPLFLSERGGGQAMSLRTIQATIRELARRAKVTRIPVSAHTCRHCFAHAFLRRNPGKLIELAALLGHESLDTTAVYLQPSAEELARAVEKDDDE
jgi:site-specific recombinase XerD